MVTASAGARRQGFVAGSRAFRAPLQPARFAVGGQGRGEAWPKAGRSDPWAERKERK
jgi:hypothetical protein